MNITKSLQRSLKYKNQNISNTMNNLMYSSRAISNKLILNSKTNISYFNKTNINKNFSFNSLNTSNFSTSNKYNNSTEKSNPNDLLNQAIKEKRKFNSANHNINFTKLKIITASSNNIALNLAYESLLIESNQIDYPILFLWQNNKNIVMGKYQNPWKECNISQMKQDKIQLARRKTGGGAVYQDLGNLCYSFFLPNNSVIPDFKKINNEIMSNMFIDLNIEAEFSGRNDIQVLGRKISGNAFRMIPETKMRKGLSLHHGTILLDVDLNNLTNYLNVNKLKLISKGVDSVRSRVVNLKELYSYLTIDVMFDSLKKNFIEYYKNSSNKNEIQVVSNLMPDIHNKNNEINEDDIVKKDMLEKEFNMLTSWDWLYGNTPEFSNSLEHKFVWGLIDLSLNVINGRLTNAQIFSDTLDEHFIESIRDALNEIDYSNVNYNYDNEGIERLINDVEKILKNNLDFDSNVDFNNKFSDIKRELPNKV